MSMAGTAAKKGKKEKGGGGNYVVKGKDGNLFIASGKTGKVGTIKKKDQNEIESLIKQRQALGLKLSRLLDEQGYVVAVSHPTNVIYPGIDDE
jgi:hypothetical protein